jgi:hypothetical protein
MPVYFANPSTPEVRQAMADGLLGAMLTPRQGYRPAGFPLWCADNGRFGQGWPGYHRWAAWLKAQPQHGCAFAVAPDVPFDAIATLRQASPGLRFIRRLGYPAALAAQNGLEHLQVPWDTFDVLFIGGDTAWKLGPAARALAADAQARGKSVHMGRVNSLRRYRYAEAIGCTSVDGTYLAFGPDINLPKLLGWSASVRGQLTLFGGAA